MSRPGQSPGCRSRSYWEGLSGLSVGVGPATPRYDAVACESVRTGVWLTTLSRVQEGVGQHLDEPGAHSLGGPACGI